MTVLDAINPLNLTNITSAPEEINLLLSDISNLILLFQAIGGAFVLWLIISLIRLYLLRKRERKIEEMMRDVKELKNYILNLKNRKN